MRFILFLSVCVWGGGGVCARGGGGGACMRMLHLPLSSLPPPSTILTQSLFTTLLCVVIFLPGISKPVLLSHSPLLILAGPVPGESRGDGIEQDSGSLYAFIDLSTVR